MLGQIPPQYTLLALRCVDVHSQLLGLNDGPNP